MSKRRILLIVVALGIALLAVFGRARFMEHPPLPSSRATTVRQVKRSEMTQAEIKYGIAPTPDPSVTYQPDVIIVGGGAEAIRGMSGNGLTWTIDASAPRAGDLVPGKVLFLTNRAVGRVIDVQKDGGTLVVTLGPVLITDVIRNCHIDPGPIAIDFSEAIAYEAPDLPGRVIPATNVAAAAPADAGAGIALVSFQAPAPPAPPAGDDSARDVSNLVYFKVVPTAGVEGIGLRGTSDGGGLKMSLEAFVWLNQPDLIPKLIIDDGTLRGGTVELTGAAGLTLMFKAGTDVGMKANVKGRLQAVPDFSVPIGGPVPLAVTVRQQLLVGTALGVRNSTLSARGDYSFKGSFKVGYEGSQWTLFGPSGFSAKESLMKSADGLSMAASGLNLTHQMKVVFGVGAFGFATGPYFSLNSAAGLFKGSDIGMIQCKETTIVVGMSGGIGYLIPKPVADVINFVLGTLHIKYEVPSSGGLETDPMTIVNSTSTLPGCKAGSQ